MPKGNYERVYFEYICGQCGEGFRSVKKIGELCGPCVDHNRKARWRFRRRSGILVGHEALTQYTCQALVPEVEFGILVGWVPCGKEFGLKRRPQGRPRCPQCKDRENKEHERHKKKRQIEGGWKTLVYTPEELEIWDTLYGGVDALRMRLEEDEKLRQAGGRMLYERPGLRADSSKSACERKERVTKLEDWVKLEDWGDLHQL